MTELRTDSGVLKTVYPTADLAQLRQHFIYQEAFFPYADAAAVEDFLQQHPGLVALLMEARQHIARYFGADCRLTLQPFYDPEDLQHPHLLLLIGATQSMAEALRLLDRFDEEWWFDADAEADTPGLLIIKLG